MRVHKWDGLKKKSFTPEQLERLEQRTRKTLLDMRLRELRKIAGVTHVPELQTDERGPGPLAEVSAVIPATMASS